MQQQAKTKMWANVPMAALITPDAPIHSATHGGRAKCLQRLVRLELPVPTTVALSFEAVKNLSAGDAPSMAELINHFDEEALLCVRPSSEDPDWGGPGAFLNIGMNCERRNALAKRIGKTRANSIYQRFIQSYAVHVDRMDPDVFDVTDEGSDAAVAATLAIYADEMEEDFPQERAQQLYKVLRSMARIWDGTTARLLRQAKGAPVDAGLGLVIQEMALGFGKDETEGGAGTLQLVNGETGAPQIIGRYQSQRIGREGNAGKSGLYLSTDQRGPSLQEHAPEAFDQIVEFARLMRKKLREEMKVEFTLQRGQVYILDGIRVPRSARAGVRIAVSLAKEGIIPRQEAIMRTQPKALNELLHRQVAPDAPRDLLGRGIAASPGAASGKIVFTAAEAQASAARGEACILVRRETSPEDIRGMHAAVGVLTERGGTTSHAAVIGRGMGLPCVVGASALRFRINKGQLIVPDGRVFTQGDVITIDGSSGEILAGSPDMVEAALDEYFNTLLSWADEFRDIDIRANADTPADAQTARNFSAKGIGLCRTEHMFFDPGRLTAMREMIFARSPEDRRAALDRILPMQRDDFAQLFRIMQGQPVCIRLFDPPLHEFLPTDRAGLRDLAEALDLPLSVVTRRVEALAEYNPMLGMRGVRLGITVPEIYDMQARAIFEATVEASLDGEPVVPEIMIPLVSAKREVELVKTRVDAVAAAVKTEKGATFTYRLGVMVETPRAALRAEEITQHADFLSFGTNDLTQMTYGLSRDDAGRFMSSYVQQGVFEEDPFLTLDLEGVGELLSTGARRGRRGRPNVTLSICGEHGGNKESIEFCRKAGFDYVSCSPFRVPGARLAAAQLTLMDPPESS